MLACYTGYAYIYAVLVASYLSPWFSYILNQGNVTCDNFFISFMIPEMQFGIFVCPRCLLLFFGKIQNTRNDNHNEQIEK